MPDDTTSTPSYLDLASQGYGLVVDAYATLSQSALGYTKSLYDIVSKPYTSTAVETTMRENFDRAGQLVSLTVSQLQSNGQKQTELAEKTAAYATKVQESSFGAVKGLVKTGVSNLHYVKDTADAQFDGLVKRVDDLHTRVATAASKN
jgi:hypothetical protein